MGMRIVSVDAALVAGSATARTEEGFVLEGLYVTHLRSLVRTAALLVGDSGRAEEIAQEAFIRAHASWHRLEDPTKGLAYLRRIVVNLSRSAVRRQVVAGRYHEDPAADAASAEDAALVALGRSEMLFALNALPRRQREALVLRYYGGLSEAEAAAAMKVSVGAVKAYASRGLVELGKHLEVTR